ncbi:MAG: FAD-dependent thymidylate synthase, partial [Candidatus Omnitrophota bacterium]
MKVYLAGYNVDTGVLQELEEKAGKCANLTPEVLSAAYARISRDPRPINEIRKDAREEVEKSRRSNSTIIFKMGHHSVAEHAVFNLDILGVSRLAMEEVEKFRLCAYTEKSQRYITLDKDFVIPEEIKGTPL